MGGRMMRYDPMVGPDPAERRALDEMEQLNAILAFHRRAHIELPNEMLHATIHSVVESQVAAGSETPVAETLQRLIDEGLDRHDAVHAVGMVLAGHIHDLLQGDSTAIGDPNAPYTPSLGGSPQRAGESKRSDVADLRERPAARPPQTSWNASDGLALSTRRPGMAAASNPATASKQRHRA